MRAGHWALLVLALGLGGCDFGWLGDPEDPPLPGTRQPVLLLETTAAADPAAGTPMVLPAERSNADWPQVRGDATGSLQHVSLPATLRRVWSADVGRGNGKTSRIISPPVVADGIVFAADASANVSALRLENGQRLWRHRFDLDSDRRLGAGLAAVGGGVFVATARGEVAAMVGHSGAVVCAVALGGPVRAAPPLAGRVVLVTTAENQT